MKTVRSWIESFLDEDPHSCVCYVYDPLHRELTPSKRYQYAYQDFEDNDNDSHKKSISLVQYLQHQEQFEIKFDFVVFVV